MRVKSQLRGEDRFTPARVASWIRASARIAASFLDMSGRIYATSFAAVANQFSVWIHPPA
jgi:hypothetical protein